MDTFSLNDLLTGFRFVQKTPSFLRHRISPEEALATLRARRENREGDFLRLMKAAVYENPRSPYLALLKHAGCEYEDLKAAVHAGGLEGTLEKLFDQGVYLTVNEFKGRAPVRRGGYIIQAGPSLLRNPLAAHHLQAHSSGSGGKKVPVLIDLAFVRDRAINHFLALQARNGMGWRHAIWGVPGNTDMVRVLELSALGSPPARWFSQVDVRSRQLHPRYRWSARFLRWSGRVGGTRLPAPEYVSSADPKPIVDWMTGTARQEQTAHLVTWAGTAVRICQFAAAAGADLSHVQFSIGGEPVTAARLATIRRTGATAVPRFMAMECGYIAYGCLKPSSPDDFHIFDDMHGVIQAGDRGPEHGLPPGALLISSLRPTAPFIFLNVSLGDQARMIPGTCGCPLESLGWQKRIREVRSFEKLTSGGMTFLDTDILKVLAEDLPSRFGGSEFDYQLVEDEDAAGTPRVRLVISPVLGPLDNDAVQDFFLKAVGAGSGAERVMGLQWRAGDYVTVERAFPEQASSGKILHVLKKRR